MAESESTILYKGVCQTFTPQQWRKTKCKLCFHDIIEHTKTLTKDESEELIKSCMNDGDETETDINEEVEEQEETNEAKNTAQNEHIRYSSQSNYTQGSSKGSSDRLDVDEDVGKDSEDETETDGANTPLGRRKRRGKLSASLYSLDKQDSMDNEDGISTPNRSIQKKRTRSYRKNSSNLLQLSAMMRSSNSSLCSFTSELTDGFSDYDYDVRSITDDTDDYAEINDVIDELEMIKPELKVRVENERRISRTKIFDLERELEGQQDYYRASEIAKDRQIKSFQREIEGLKLELSSVKAHENILALKSRLESEGKSTRILDLEQQIQILKDENTRLSSPDIYQSREDALSREVKNAHERISHLEEENRATEERLKLAEDLQSNDRELLEVLRRQLSSIDEELVSAQDANRLLEDKLKHMETVRSDFLKEQDKNTKLNKEMEGYRQKIKRRDRHIEDLEDDNVKLQQLKRELESQLSKKEFKVKKMERKVSSLKKEVIKCNREIADLTGENKTLEEVRRLTDLQLQEVKQKSESKSEVQNGEEIFKHSLEDLMKHNETRVKELELENDRFLKQIHEMYQNLGVAEEQIESQKEELKDADAKVHKLRQENKHSDKKIEMLHRKLLKSEKEKKRAVNRQNSAEIKLSQFEQQDGVSSMSTNVDENEEKSVRMLKLKLQSTEAKLSMIEGNKGYLETKVHSLERKLRDKDKEINRLHDSLERDSGAPLHEDDRFDALESENDMLQSKLDDLMIENITQKQSLNQLKESNNYLEVTIKTLNDKLDVCTQRLKDVEEANHKLGREALRRTQSISSAQDEQDASINELKAHNKLLQEKIKQFDNVEELIERLEFEVKKEQGQAQWYHDENAHLKIKLAKMSETVRELEESKKDFENSIEILSEENRDLNSEVKRMEEKLEIYCDLFAKESTLYSSLKRRSVQSDRDEEKIIENALSPLMEEIKEKDLQIKDLQKAVEEKNVFIHSLTEEIDLLSYNLATIAAEKIKRLQNGDSPRDSYSSSDEGILALDQYRKGSKSYENNKTTNDTEKKTDGSENAVFSPVRLEIQLNDSDKHPASNSSSDAVVLSNATEDQQTSSDSHDSNAATLASDAAALKALQLAEEELSVSKETFYNMIQQHEDDLKRKDLEYYRSLIPDESESSTHTDLYRTIECALLDQYKDDEPSPSLPSLTNQPTDDISLLYKDMSETEYGQQSEYHQHESVIENKKLVSNTYEQLAELEDMVRKASITSSIPTSPTTASIVQEDALQEVIQREQLYEQPLNFTDISSDHTQENKSEDHDPGTLFSDSDSTKLKPEDVKEEVSSLRISNRSSRELSMTSGESNTSIDLSGLDDLLAEVNKRNSLSRTEQPTVTVVQKTTKKEFEPRKAARPLSVPKAIMPSIRTTKRRIIKLGGLGRSDSFDSATARRNYSNQSICSITSRSSSNISRSSLPPVLQHEDGACDQSIKSLSNSSSMASSATSSVASVIFVPASEVAKRRASSQQSSSTENMASTSSTTPPIQRPELDANKLLNSTDQKVE